MENYHEAVAMADESGSYNLAAKHCHFIGKCGLIPAARSGAEVNEHNSRKEQLLTQNNKEKQQGDTHVGE